MTGIFVHMQVGLNSSLGRTYRLGAVVICLPDFRDDQKSSLTGVFWGLRVLQKALRTRQMRVSILTNLNRLVYGTKLATSLQPYLRGFIARRRYDVLAAEEELNRVFQKKLLMERKTHPYTPGSISRELRDKLEKMERSLKMRLLTKSFRLMIKRKEEFASRWDDQARADFKSLVIWGLGEPNVHTSTFVLLTKSKSISVKDAQEPPQMIIQQVDESRKPSVDGSHNDFLFKFQEEYGVDAITPFIFTKRGREYFNSRFGLLEPHEHVVGKNFHPNLTRAPRGYRVNKLLLQANNDHRNFTLHMVDRKIPLLEVPPALFLWTHPRERLQALGDVKLTYPDYLEDVVYQMIPSTLHGRVVELTIAPLSDEWMGSLVFRFRRFIRGTQIQSDFWKHEVLQRRQYAARAPPPINLGSRPNMKDNSLTSPAVNLTIPTLVSPSLDLTQGLPVSLVVGSGLGEEFEGADSSWPLLSGPTKDKGKMPYFDASSEWAQVAKKRDQVLGSSQVVVPTSTRNLCSDSLVPVTLTPSSSKLPNQTNSSANPTSTNLLAIAFMLDQMGCRDKWGPPLETSHCLACSTVSSPWMSRYEQWVCYNCQQNFRMFGGKFTDPRNEEEELELD